MKLTGPAAAETTSEEAGKGLPGRKDPAACGGVRVERTVRPSPKLVLPELELRLVSGANGFERGTMLPTPKE